MSKLTLHRTNVSIPDDKNKKIWFLNTANKNVKVHTMTWNQFLQFNCIYQYWCEIPEFVVE